MKWRITFEIELPTESYNKVSQWAEYHLGFNGSLSGDNPCVDIELPAKWEQLNLNSLRVTRAL